MRWPSQKAIRFAPLILPFRLLQPDAQIDVCSGGIPEAPTALLSNQEGVTLVSPRVAQE